MWVPQIVNSIMTLSKKVPILVYFYAITALRAFPYVSYFEIERFVI